MTNSNRRVVLTLAAMLTGMVGLAGYQAHALQRMAQLEPAVIATVDLLTVFDAIEEKADAAQELEAELEALLKEKESKENLLMELEANIEDFAPGTPQHQEALDRLTHEALRYQGWSTFANRKMDILNAEMLQKIYLSIKQEASALATQNGYDLVLVDDELAQFIPGTETEIMRQIASRRMLYSTDVIDMTDELIAHMNAAVQGG